MHEQRAGRADLDITRVRADSEHGWPGLRAAPRSAGQPSRAAPGHQGGDSGQKVIGPDRFLQELISSVPQCPHRRVERLVRGDHDDWQRWREPAQRRQEFQAGHPRQFRVSQHQVPGLRTDEAERDDRVRRVPDVEPAALAQHLHGEMGGHRVVLDDQDPSW